MKRYWTILSLNMLLLAGCTLIDYHPYDVRIEGETAINQKNIKRIEQECKDKTSIRFAMIGDSQRWYDETTDFVSHINQRNDIDFVIHGGDMSDFGLTDEFIWQRNIMNQLKIPYVAIIGNHDCLGTGEDAYHKIFGKDNFSFIAGDVKFICLNTNAMEYDYSNPIPNFNFIEHELTDRKDEFTKTIFAMHAIPFNEQFNNNVAHVFQHYITKAPDLQFCTAAHDHTLAVKDLFEDGILYYISSCMKDRNYLLFTIKPEGYDYEVVNF